MGCVYIVSLLNVFLKFRKKKIIWFIIYFVMIRYITIQISLK